MVVIFAGCDCAGKSTCFNLIDKSIWTKKKGVASSNLSADIETLKSEVESGSYVMYDRNPVLDDFVYSQIFSHKDSELMDKIPEVSDLLRKCIIIYFDCDDGEIIRRMRKRGDEYVEESQIPEIKAEYEKVFKLLNIEPNRISTTYRDPYDVAEDVEDIIR